MFRANIWKTIAVEARCFTMRDIGAISKTLFSHGTRCVHDIIANLYWYKYSMNNILIYLASSCIVRGLVAQVS